MFITIAMSKAHSTAGNIFNELLLTWSTFCRWKWVSMGRLTKAATCADDIPALSTQRGIRTTCYATAQMTRLSWQDDFQALSESPADMKLMKA